ncbi:macrophage mannose receptor 1-like [Poecilia formosa]|uniref:macrophage mannose receptor 1-like n=1 Tax=Poecilia formosa TaxID=48698 RepID=UPI0007B9AF26|nr:PREDICTED: macrophage mannose receptor 1-like [Poecilia formosa]
MLCGLGCRQAAREHGTGLLQTKISTRREKTIISNGAQRVATTVAFTTTENYICGCTDYRHSVCFDRTKHGVDQYILYPERKSWTAARDFCRKTYTDLVSLRNDAEYQTVQDLVNGTALHVGLFRDSWVWSDMTDSSFRYWQEKQGGYTSSLEYCAALLKTESGKWGDRNCTEAHPFVCKCKTRKVQIIKLRISQQKESMLDLNEPAVQNSILEQMKLKMSENISEVNNLQWRSSWDGKVFIKQPAVNGP